MTALNDGDAAPLAGLAPASMPISDRWRHRRRDRRIGRLAVGSLLVHLLLVLLIIGIAKLTVPPEALPPPAVAMLWESGKAPAPSASDQPHAAATPAPPPAAAPVAPPPPTTPPAAAESSAAPPLPIPPIPPAAPPAPPAPSATANVPAAALARPPAPAPAPAAPQTLAARPPPPAPSPPRPPNRPQTEAMLRPRPRPLPPSPFSSPMNLSYGPTQPHRPPSSPDSARPSESPLIGPTPGPSGNDTIHLEPPGQGERTPGTDWSNELSDWIESHKYYPPQAAENGEEGTAEVRVTIDRYGHVKTVELVSRSGSIWLDMASQALFRDRTVPALPPDSPLQTVTFDLTTHYILIRQ